MIVMELNITGMRDGIDGDYLIESVTHSYQKTTGIVTSLEARTMATG